MARVSPKQLRKLAGKLLAIRNNLSLTQAELVISLSKNVEVTQSQISSYERGSRLPSFLTLLAYAKLYGVSTDVLIDDVQKLPKP